MGWGLCGAQIQLHWESLLYDAVLPSFCPPINLPTFLLPLVHAAFLTRCPQPHPPISRLVSRTGGRVGEDGKRSDDDEGMMTLSVCSGTVLGQQCVVAAPLGDWETFTGPDVFIDFYARTTQVLRRRRRDANLLRYGLPSFPAGGSHHRRHPLRRVHAHWILVCESRAAHRAARGWSIPTTARTVGELTSF
ncbi:hypothetical protein T492DRAFT_238571 [Pavlovales sp. CCMP2436]|nr:hypothetical protein T492DRAFT_238571 [Pavlovales sp. CCMP2436]